VRPPALENQPAQAGLDRGALATVYLTVFLDLFGFGVILPALPYYAERLGASGFWLGALFTAYSGAQLFGAAYLGRLSDRIGRRPVLLLSLVGSTIAFVLCGFAKTLALLLAARVIAGGFGGSIAAAQAYIADVTRPEERARWMGMLGAAIGLGFVLGPAVGALLAHYGWGFGAASFVAAGLAAANLVATYFRLKEPPRRAPTRARAGMAELLQAFQRPWVSRILAATFLAMCAAVAMETTLALLVERRFGLAEGGLGALLVFAGVVQVIVQGGLIGRLVARWGERRVAIAGSALSALGLAGLPFAPSLGLAVAALGLLAAGMGCTSPTLATLLSRASAADEQGGVLGLGQSMGALARASAPLAAGALWDRGASAPYWAASLCALSVALLVLFDGGSSLNSP
jgi:DHA1 family tetracycline resistance protein-like MFS transporter